MTAPQADGAGRTSRELSPRGPVAALSGLAILLLVGLLIRLTFAYVVLPKSGFESDIGTFTAWALNLAEHGPGTFYATAGFADYPPGYLYVLWLVGSVGHLLAPLGHTDPVSATAALIKLPAIIADLVVGFVLYQLVRSWRAPRRDARQVALLAAGLYVLNPVSWYDSAIWGQTDAFGALITLLTVAALVRGNSEGASALAVVAALIKPQFGIVLLPLVGIVLLRRHLLRPDTSPRHPVLLPASLRSWFETEHGPWRLVSSAAAAMAVLLVLITPFSLDLISFLGQMQKTAAGYPYLSVNAYNPWALIGSGGRSGLAFGGGWSEDIIPLLGPIPAVAIGAVLLALGFAAGTVRAAWRDDRRTILIVGIFLALSFFMLPTRVHERYMFPIFGLLPLLAAVDRRWLWALVALSAAAFINFHGVLTTELYATPNLEHLPFGDLFRQPLGIVTSVVLHIAGFAFVAWQLRPAAAEERDPFGVRASTVAQPPEPAGAVAGAPVSATPAATPTATRGATPAMAASADTVASSSEPVDIDNEPSQEPIVDSLRRWFRQLVGYRSNRRDRSALLIGEPSGRLGRRDLLLVLAVFAAALLLRTYRLEVPYGMHFDEVYHARTGMEFLQDWQYDMPHGIYEYTHPHLAKYMMAWGIQVLGNNRVTDTRQLGIPVRAAAIEKRWSPFDNVNADNGDRVYVVGDTEVRAYALATKQQVATIPGSFLAIAVDDGGHTAYLASADGQISSFDTTQLDGVLPSAPVQVSLEPLTQLEGFAGEINRLTVASSRLIAVSSGGTVVSLDPETGTEQARTTYPEPKTVIGVSGRSVVVVNPDEVSDIPALAQELGDLIGRKPEDLQRVIEGAASSVPVAGFISKTSATELNKAIEADELTGVSVDSRNALAIGLSTGVVLVDAVSLKELAFVGTFAPVTGMALVERGLEQPTLFAAAGRDLVTVTLPSDDAARIGRYLRDAQRRPGRLLERGDYLCARPGSRPGRQLTDGLHRRTALRSSLGLCRRSTDDRAAGGGHGRPAGPAGRRPQRPAGFRHQRRDGHR